MKNSWRSNTLLYFMNVFAYVIIYEPNIIWNVWFTNEIWLVYFVSVVLNLKKLVYRQYCQQKKPQIVDNINTFCPIFKTLLTTWVNSKKLSLIVRHSILVWVAYLTLVNVLSLTYDAMLIWLFI